ncbi:hypothetical protein FQR65_LT00945 [Abscondita terminalis]|nr:hypothetical protein FQR65_LT00945 [Abscondita terminalis]
MGLNGKPVDIMVHPRTQKPFISMLKSLKIPNEILISNVDTIVKREQLQQKQSPKIGKGKTSFTHYHRLDQINSYLDRLAVAYHKNVTVKSIGESFYKRDVKVIQISSNSKGEKPIIFIDAGISAREWIATAMTQYIINQLVENPANKNLYKRVDWHILPVVNPDGYEYTHTTDRFWKKSRAPQENCVGVDLSRNFGFHWGKIGASTNSCSIAYKGPSAFSEIETRNVKNYIDNLRNRIKLYLSLHSYGNYILYPWGYTTSKATDEEELNNLAQEVNKAIVKARGEKYKIGRLSKILYPVAGDSSDWAKGSEFIQLSYTIQLPGGGSQGFDPFPNNIISVCKETFPGIKVYAKYIDKKFVYPMLKALLVTMSIYLFFCCFVITSINANYTNYQGFQVFRLQQINENQSALLLNLSNNYSYDFWSPINLDQKPIDVMVPPSSQTEFLKFLTNNNITYTTFINNVEKTLPKKETLSARSRTISFLKFHRFNEASFMKETYPHLVRLESIGYSYEGRDVKVIKISSNPEGNKPVIFVDAGIHAREWLAPSQALFIITRLVEDPKYRYLLNKVDWHILPVVNPDGYEYSHNYNPIWRKTRSLQSNGCYGVDANRNFDIYWGKIGVSYSECSHTYLGPRPFSEKETQNVKNYIYANSDNIKLYLTLHSYGNYILYPWGYTFQLPHDAFELHNLAEGVSRAIVAAGGKKFTVGSSSNVLYAAAGGSDDWAKAKAGIQLSYTIELPGGRKNGFHPEGDEIFELVSQTFEGIVVFGKYIALKFGLS